MIAFTISPFINYVKSTLKNYSTFKNTDLVYLNADISKRGPK